MEVLQTKSRSSGDKEANIRLKTTAQGIPLVPQPSDDPDDPLVRGFFLDLLIYGLLTVKWLLAELEHIHQTCRSGGPRIRIFPGQILGHSNRMSTDTCPTMPRIGSSNRLLP